MFCSVDYSKYEPYIVKHESDPKLLYCKVTNTYINKIPEKVRKHVTGYNYLR